MFPPHRPAGDSAFLLLASRGGGPQLGLHTPRFGDDRGRCLDPRHRLLRPRPSRSRGSSGVSASRGMRSPSEAACSWCSSPTFSTARRRPRTWPPTRWPGSRRPWPTPIGSGTSTCSSSCTTRCVSSASTRTTSTSTCRSPAAASCSTCSTNTAFGPFFRATIRTRPSESTARAWGPCLGRGFRCGRSSPRPARRGPSWPAARRCPRWAARAERPRWPSCAAP